MIEDMLEQRETGVQMGQDIPMALEWGIIGGYYHSSRPVP
jgi:hypothetical protein